MPPSSFFFDLNVPYAAAAAAAAANARDVRLRSVATLLDLGYSGAAYNLSLRGGVLSDRDTRCSVVPFPLPSLLAAAPSLVASASFHRRLLSSGAPDYPGPAFRQFSRVTVSVDTVAAASAVGSTTAALRGYDVVAVRPQSQSAFEHVCKFSEADLISVDFSQKVPFRLRQQSVKLAIKRGLFFEITYSQLLSDNANSKRQVLGDAKMLADWTKGKNLIVSSGASNANEVRGPNDVSNLISFLLGLSKERAKAAISDNCRTLLAKALRRKNFYKETIRIERMPANKSNLEPFSVGDWIKWDPLSNGEGDLPSLEEISKNPSLVNPKPSNSNSNKIKSVDFNSLLHEKPFLLSQHADKLHETEPVSGNREENVADGMLLDDQLAQMKASFLKDDSIGLVHGGAYQSDGTLHPQHKIEDQLKKRCNFEGDNSAPDGMQLDDQVALLTECDLNDAQVELLPQPEGTFHNNMEAPLKECNYKIDHSALHSDGCQKEPCMGNDVQCDNEVPLSGNNTDLERFVEGPDIPFIQNEHKTDQNAPEGVVGICDETMVTTSINNEATVKESNFSSSNLIHEVCAESMKIDQLNDEKEGEVKNVNNRDALVETEDVAKDTSKINLIDDEEQKREIVNKNIDVKENQEREPDIIKLDDTRGAVDTTSTSSSFSLMEAVLHDLRGKPDGETPTFAQGSSINKTKGKRKQKGLPVHQPHTMPLKGPFKHMLFRKKARR